MTTDRIADLVASIRSRATRSAGEHPPADGPSPGPDTSPHRRPVDQSSRGRHPSGERGTARTDQSERTVACLVPTCPECGRQRPYPVSREAVVDGSVPYQVEQGIGLHLGIAHDVAGDRSEEEAARVLADAEHRAVPEDVLEDVEGRNQKWSDYEV